ncbi:MAG: Fic family protein [Deltaproteobacteria bacterium]|nr:Fic family protein [Deltaproteobacteria bacterium]
MSIATIKSEVEHLTLSLVLTSKLRQQAKIRSTHYSTRIEGNRLTLAEATQVVKQGKITFRGRERDVREVRNYWNALLKVEQWARERRIISEKLLRDLHALVEIGPRARPTPYRDGQNVISDAVSGAIVYLPPEAKDVPDLMAGLVKWIKEAERANIPMPLIAGLAHYQFVTIHPYFDGNGRTARLLATFILQRGGFGLNGYYSLEEHHARDLSGYYQALAVHPHHNYYEGRAQADLTLWLEYFIAKLADTFAAVKTEANRLTQHGVSTIPKGLQKLDQRAKVVISLFVDADHITTSEVAQVLGLSERMARLLLADWVNAGWLVIVEASRRKRNYKLSAKYRKFIGKPSAK